MLLEACQIRIEYGSRAPAERIREIEIVVLKAADQLVPRETLQIFLQLARIIPEFAAVEYLGSKRHEHPAELFRNDAVFDVLGGIAPFYELREKFFVRTVKTVFVRWIALFRLFGLLYLLGLKLHLLFLFIKEEQPGMIPHRFSSVYAQGRAERDRKS